MLERIERHQQAVGIARMFHRPYSTIKFANNGTFELDFTYNENRLPGTGEDKENATS